MRKLMRKVLALSLCACMMVGMATSASANQLMPENNLKNKATKGIDVMDLYNNPENYSNTTLVMYDDVEEYVNAIGKDTNLSEIEKEILIGKTNAATMFSASYYKYGTITETVKVNGSYYVYPYFYIKFEYSEGIPSPNRMVSVENASINRTYLGVSKQFQGTLYYNLESGNSLYWDLNGDFYNNGTTTLTGGGSVGVGGIATASFSASNTSSHYQYKQQAGRYYAAGMQP